MQPLISIITITYNNQEGLLRTIQSVIAQTYPKLEFIIIDGGSTDESVETIIENEKKINYWVSEKDSGIYDAMNKGIKQAKGDYLLMLNAGDYLVNEKIIEQVVNSKMDSKIVYGDVIWKTNEQEQYGSFPDKLTFNYFQSQSIGHQAAFIHKGVHETAGLYNTSYKIVADWVLFALAIFRYKMSYQHISLAISVCSRDGISCNPDNWGLIINERNSFLEKEFRIQKKWNNLYCKFKQSKLTGFLRKIKNKLSTQ